MSKNINYNDVTNFAEDASKAFSKNLLNLINESSKKQKKIANEIGVSEATISSYISYAKCFDDEGNQVTRSYYTGRNKPSDLKIPNPPKVEMENALKLAAYFNVSLDYLFGLTTSRIMLKEWRPEGKYSKYGYFGIKNPMEFRTACDVTGLSNDAVRYLSMLSNKDVSVRKTINFLLEEAGKTRSERELKTAVVRSLQKKSRNNNADKNDTVSTEKSALTSSTDAVDKNLSHANKQEQDLMKYLQSEEYYSLRALAYMGNSLLHLVDTYANLKISKDLYVLTEDGYIERENLRPGNRSNINQATFPANEILKSYIFKLISRKLDAMQVE